jgi:regulator of protease activity HflC (stomatin/prohibitin superfamily)
MTNGRTASLWQAFTVAEPVMWLVLGLLPLAALAARTLRVVGEDERLVVRRLGRAAGVRGPGLVVVWPVLERGVRVSLRLTYLDLFAKELVTRDGVGVRVRATAVAAVDDPVRYATTADDPLTATTIAAEAELRREVGRRDLADLPGLVAHAGAELAERVSRSTRRWGVQVTLLDVADVQVPLRGELIARVRRREPPRPAAAVPLKEGDIHR